MAARRVRDAAGRRDCEFMRVGEAVEPVLDLMRAFLRGGRGEAWAGAVEGAGGPGGDAALDGEGDVCLSIELVELGTLAGNH